ncbi:MAG: T9SS type A sorting domain-containing protein, partial [Crocinitomicaceae bacterium]
FVRFPAYSETQTATQVNSFGIVEPTKIHNLAGKYQQGYGTPFDLDDLADSTGIDLNHITHVKIVDVVGSINPLYASYDALGRPVNDPFPTAFASGGFDLDAVGVLNQAPLGIKENGWVTELIEVYPQPFNNELMIAQLPFGEEVQIQIFSETGQIVYQNTTIAQGTTTFYPQLNAGIYFLHISSQQKIEVRKILRE